MNNDPAAKQVDSNRRDAKGRFKPGVSGNPEGCWKPGESGNPKGPIPKEFSLTSLAKAMLEADPEEAKKMARKWLDQVKAGSTEARRDLQDRLEGKVHDKLSIGGTVEVILRRATSRSDDTESP